jgi:hypothetical protein
MALPITLVISQKMISDKITAAGLDDAQIFEAVRFKDLDDVISALFPGVVAVLEPEAEVHVKILLVTTATRASFSRRMEDDGLPGGLSDMLWAAGKAREAARQAELAELRKVPLSLLGKGPATKRQGVAPWRPSKRARPTGSLASLDLALAARWGQRLGQALHGTPAGEMAGEADDPSAFFVSLIGRLALPPSKNGSATGSSSSVGLPGRRGGRGRRPLVTHWATSTSASQRVARCRSRRLSGRRYVGWSPAPGTLPQIASADT